MHPLKPWDSSKWRRKLFRKERLPSRFLQGQTIIFVKICNIRLATFRSALHKSLEILFPLRSKEKFLDCSKYSLRGVPSSPTQMLESTKFGCLISILSWVPIGGCAQAQELSLITLLQLIRAAMNAWWNRRSLLPQSNAHLSETKWGWI